MKNPDPALYDLGKAAERELAELQRYDHDTPTRMDGEITRGVAHRLGLRGGMIYMKQGCNCHGAPISAIVLGPAHIEGQDFSLPVRRGNQTIRITLENASFWTTLRPELWS